MNNNLLLGAKYYRYDDHENIIVVRVLKFYSETEIKIVDEYNKETKRINIKDLEEKYIRLEPHAIVNFCIAELKDGLDDIIVTMHKMSDLTSNEPTPYCVCRQNITDIFANQIQISNKMYVGCSMSLDTCPPDIDYRIMIACNNMKKCVNVCEDEEKMLKK